MLRFASTESDQLIYSAEPTAEPTDIVVAAVDGTSTWTLSNVTFNCDGHFGSMILDTGTALTLASASFVAKAGLRVTPLVGPRRTVRVANGEEVLLDGTTDVPVYLQLMLETDNGQLVAWDRFFTLKGVYVAQLGPSSPRDLYVAYRDWAFRHNQNTPQSPLGNLAYMVMSGATVVNTPRVPRLRDMDASKVIIQGVPTLASVVSESEKSEDEWRAAILERIAPEFRNTSIGHATLAALMHRRKIFGPVISADCTEEVDFTLIGEPTPVSFRVPISRKVPLADIEAGLNDWIARGIAERVPWSEPAYGFVIIVPKPGGKWRVTINPSGVNPATAKISPDGGYMPASMIREAQRVGHMSIACQLDLSEAFTTLRLGRTAQTLSTFTSPIGKLRWKHGFFGWHSFPAVFQRVVMEKLVLPTMDEEIRAIILAWVDDIVIAGQDHWAWLNALCKLLDRLLALGGRLSLHKCSFLITLIQWCGVEINLVTNSWRIDPRRVESLTATPVPTDREGLSNVLGILRHYYWGVQHQLEQRKRIALLAELDRDRVDVPSAWTPEHTEALSAALREVIAGNWQLVFDPSQPVMVSTDASSQFGFGVTATQWDSRTGEPRPISFFSKGWQQGQLDGWTPQVKECYAMRYAVTKVLPEYFPHANVILLCDNKNLSSLADSEDLRVVRWQHEIRDSGAIVRRWHPGHYNTIADFASRTVNHDGGTEPPPDEAFESYIYAIDEPSPLGEREGAAHAARPETTVVPGHLPLATMTSKIAAAQEAASAEERASWIGTHYSAVELAGRTLHLHDRLLIVPRGASDIKARLFHLAHDDNCHYSGGGRTVHNLKQQAKVWWSNMDHEIQAFVSSCYRCQFAKTGLHPNKFVGTLSPTIPPFVNHTWYVDLKGPMPDGSYLMAAVEGLVKDVRLRYLPKANATEVIEELEEVAASWGTNPVIIRSDGGPPFNSVDYTNWCAAGGITPVLGVAEHSQGQGTVETKFKGIAHALMAVLGGKAPTGWYKDARLLTKLERVIGASFTSTLGGSPIWGRTGREPRTTLSAVTADYSSADYGEQLLGLSGIVEDDVQEIVARHHAQINRAQGRASLATSLAQALTKSRYDKSRSTGDFKVGEWVLLYRAAINRLTPHFTGPYLITDVSGDNNFVHARHFLTPDAKALGPFHVSRLIRFDFSRATAKEIAEYHLSEDSAIVADIKSHRLLADGTYEFLVEWDNDPVHSWMGGYGLRRVAKAIAYCTTHSLPSPGSGPRRQAQAAPPTRGRGRGRGRR